MRGGNTQGAVVAPAQALPAAARVGAAVAMDVDNAAEKLVGRDAMDTVELSAAAGALAGVAAQGQQDEGTGRGNTRDHGEDEEGENEGAGEVKGGKRVAQGRTALDGQDEEDGQDGNEDQSEEDDGKSGIGFAVHEWVPRVSISW